MPDGDKIHVHLPQRYQQVYKQICEGSLSDEELSYEVSQPLIKDIQQYGNGPIRLIKEVATRLEQIPTGPLFEKSDHWGQMSQEIDRIAQQRANYCPRRGLELATNSCKEKLLDLRDGKDSHSLCQEMVHKYVRKIYNANLEERVPLSQQHYGNMSPAIVEKQLASMEPYVEERIATISRRIAQRGSVSSLNPSSLRRSRPAIGLYDNLLPD